MYSKVMHFKGGHLTDTIEFFDFKIFNELLGISWFYDEHSVRLINVRGDLGQKLVSPIYLLMQ